ncbi:transposable element gene, partial [Prunus dulcis]
VIVSEMDKSWMHSDRRSKAYEFGCGSIFELCCRKSSKLQHISVVHVFGVGIIRDHVYFNGIDQSYKNWTFHGEPWEATTNASRNVEDGHNSRLLGLKSHDCHTLMQQLLPVAIRSVLEKPARYAITRLCFFFNAICAKTVDVSKLDKLEEDVVVTLCLLEKYFPPSFFDIMVHLVVHLVREVRLCGPVYFRWMYPFERYMKVLKGYVQNRTRPEGCIAERYIAEEAVEFCTQHLSDVSTVGVPSSQKMGVSKPLSGCTVSVVDQDLLNQAHLYVLENTEEVLPYIEQHMIHIKTAYPKFRKRTKWLQDKHNSTFIQWLRFKVQSELEEDNMAYQKI